MGSSVKAGVSGKYGNLPKVGKEREHLRRGCRSIYRPELITSWGFRRHWGMALTGTSRQKVVRFI
jgi:hypothetical protein